MVPGISTTLRTGGENIVPNFRVADSPAGASFIRFGSPDCASVGAFGFRTAAAGVAFGSATITSAVVVGGVATVLGVTASERSDSPLDPASAVSLQVDRTRSDSTCCRRSRRARLQVRGRGSHSVAVGALHGLVVLVVALAFAFTLETGGAHARSGLRRSLARCHMSSSRMKTVVVGVGGERGE